LDQCSQAGYPLQHRRLPETGIMETTTGYGPTCWGSRMPAAVNLIVLGRSPHVE